MEHFQELRNGAGTEAKPIGNGWDNRSNLTQATQEETSAQKHGDKSRQKSSHSLPHLHVAAKTVNWRRIASDELCGLPESDGTESEGSSSPLSLESEKIIASRIEELSQLESPQLRELARRLGNFYNVKTLRKPFVNKEHIYSSVTVGEKWQEIQGTRRWAGLLDPIDPILRAEITRYGEFAQATYDTFDRDQKSKYCGSSKYNKNSLLERVGLENRGYEITDFLYATASLDLPYFFSWSIADDKWSKDSNWMGFVAVCTSPKEIQRLGRRDIVIAWRGTVTKLEWVKDMQNSLTPAGFDPRHPDKNVKVESGFLSLYTSKNENSRYNKTSAREQVLQAVKNLVDKYKDPGLKLSITVTGHSLGSALGTLCAYDIAESGMNLLANTPSVPKDWDADQSTETLGANAPNRDPHGDGATTSGSTSSSDRIPITVYSYGGPRVGNGGFRDRLNDLGVAVLRVVNINDRVTKVPGFIPERIENLVSDSFPVYKHVGVKLKVDNSSSPFLRDTVDLGNFHNLEAYLHLVDGFHGTSVPFEPTCRDFALVNKGTSFIKREYFIPSSWWQEENKGLVRDKDGHWIVPARGEEIFPQSPKSVDSF